MNASSAPWSSPPSLTALYQLGKSPSSTRSFNMANNLARTASTQTAGAVRMYMRTRGPAWALGRSPRCYTAWVPRRRLGTHSPACPPYDGHPTTASVAASASAACLSSPSAAFPIHASPTPPQPPPSAPSRPRMVIARVSAEPCLLQPGVDALGLNHSSASILNQPLMVSTCAACAWTPADSHAHTSPEAARVPCVTARQP